LIAGEDDGYVAAAADDNIFPAGELDAAWPWQCSCDAADSENGYGTMSGTF
jgi:hypothetical protein